MGAPGGGVSVKFLVTMDELKELGIDLTSALGQKPGQSSSTSSGSGPQDAGGGEDAQGGKGGGMSAAMVGIMAGGIIGLLSFFKDLLNQSKILNTYAQGMGKMFSAAIDILLMPFLPVLNLMLAGMSKLLAWLIDSGYLENMSRIVDQQVIPLLNSIGDGMSKLWADMNHSLNPLNWDWAALGRTAVAMLELDAAVLLGTLEILLNKIPGINFDVYGEETGPKAMAEQALSLYGGNDVKLTPEQFNQLSRGILTGAAVGGAAGTLAPIPGVGTGAGAALGTAGSTLGYLNMYKDAGGGTTGASQSPLLDMYGRGQDNPGFGKYDPSNTSINVVMNIHSQEDADREQQRLKALYERDRSAAGQVFSQPGN